MNKKYLFITQATISAILSVACLNSVKVKADKVDTPAVLLQQENTAKKSDDPLLNGKYVSNGYTDNGYTYLNPTNNNV